MNHHPDSALDHLFARSSQTAVQAHSMVVTNGCEYTISTMSRSSDKNSISRSPVGEAERAAVLLAPSRTSRLQVDAGSGNSSGYSSGGFPGGAA